MLQTYLSGLLLGLSLFISTIGIAVYIGKRQSKALKSLGRGDSGTGIGEGRYANGNISGGGAPK